MYIYIERKREREILQAMGRYLGGELSAEALTHENGVMVHQLTQTALYTVDKHGLHALRFRSHTICINLCVYVCVYIYTYIYIEREIESRNQENCNLKP